MVPKDELLEAFWPPCISEGVLQSTIRQIRRAVGDDGREQRLIRTYHGQGFRFVAPVRDAAPTPEATSSARDMAARDMAAPDMDGQGIAGQGRATPDMAVPGMAEAAAPAPASSAPPELPAAGFEERRVATVLACRLRQLATEPVEEAEAGDDPRGAFLDTAIGLVEGHGGLVLHAMPDGFTALFGAARGLEKGTRHALDCAAALAGCPEAARLRRAGLGLGFGVECGRFPILADRPEASFRGLPHHVVQAALTQADAAPCGEAVLSSRAASHLGGALRRQVGADGRLDLAALAQSRDGPAAPPVTVGFARFLGRRAEMVFLRDCLARAGRGRGEAVVLSGEAGIGKSRLLAEFLRLAEREGRRGLILRCDPRTANTPLGVMGAFCHEMLPALAEGPSASWPEDPVDRALWQDILDPGAPQPALLSGLSPHMRRQRSFGLLRALAGRFAGQGGAILAFEDMHWMDASSREALAHLSRSLDGVPVLLIATTRPAPDPGEGLMASALWLHPLERRDSLDLVQSKLGPERLSPRDAAALVDRAAGNPFFLEEMSLAVAAGSEAPDCLPDTVQEVIATRVDSLSPPARALLLATSVVGPQAAAEVMAQTVDWQAPAFDAALSELLTAGVLVEEAAQGRRRLHFRHVLLQEAAYAMLAPADRIALHRRIAQIIAVADGLAQPERLAWHHQAAGDHVAAIAQWTLAARAAQQRSASHEAIAFARNGLRLLKPGAAGGQAIRQELELQLTLAPALAAARGYGSEEVGAAYRRARDLTRSASSPRSEFRMLVGLWNYNWVRGDLALARANAEDLLELAGRAADPTLLLRAHACMGEILFHHGEFDAAAENLGAACTLFADRAEVRAATRVPAVAAHCYAAWTASFQGRSAAALGFCSRAGMIAEELVQPFSMSLYLALKAELLLFEGDAPGCLAAAREACTICAREGFPFWHGTALVNLGWAEAQSGDPARGLASLRAGIAMFEATGARVQLANWYGLLAEVLQGAGQFSAARVAADTAGDWAGRTGDVFFLPRIERTRAALQR